MLGRIRTARVVVGAGLLAAACGGESSKSAAGSGGAGAAGMGRICDPPTFEDPDVRAALEPSIARMGVENVTGAALSDVSSLVGLECLTGLHSLAVNGGTLTDLGPLDGLGSLLVVELYDLPVTDLAPLAGLTKLTQLALSGTEVSDLAPLEALDSLVSLYLLDTNVADLGPLRGSAGLKVLNASGTPLMDLEPLANLARLERLDVSRTKLTTFPPLGPPPAASSCPKLSALDTSLDTETVTQTIPMLCELGWIVEWSSPGADEQSCGAACELRR